MIIQKWVGAGFNLNQWSKIQFLHAYGGHGNQFMDCKSIDVSKNESGDLELSESRGEIDYVIERDLSKCMQKRK